MARIGVTYVDVAQAANQIIQANANPTVDGVRNLLGTGSKSTIAPFLKEWKAKQEGFSEDVKAGLPLELVSVIKSLYERMQNEVSLRADEQKTQYHKALETLRAELNQANDALKQHQEQAEKINNQKIQLESKNLELSTANTKLSNENTKLATLNEQLLAQREDNNIKLKYLEGQLHLNQVNLEHYRESVSVQRNEERVNFERERQQLEQSLRQLNKDHSGLVKMNAELNKQFRSLADEKSKVSEQASSTKELNKQLNQSLRELQKNTEVLEKENTTVISKLNNSSIIVTKLETQISTYKKENIELRTRNEKTSGRLESTQLDVGVLKEEKARIEGEFRQLQKMIN